MLVLRRERPFTAMCLEVKRLRELTWTNTQKQYGHTIVLQ